MQKMTGETRLNAIRNEIHDIVMHLNVQENRQQRQRACERALRARRGIEAHFESKRLARHLDDELNEFG